MRKDEIIRTEILELQNDIMRAEIDYRLNDLTFEEFSAIKNRYTVYIECFQFALGEIDVYGIVD